LAVAGPLVGGGMRGHRLLARPHHGLERLALMGEVRPCRLDEIGYEVVPTHELHVDRRERVVEAVARSDELVVLDDGPYEHGREQYSENRKTVHRVHSSTPPELPEDVELSVETASLRARPCTARRTQQGIRPACFRQPP